jgi:hypothetical protein
MAYAEAIRIGKVLLEGGFNFEGPKSVSAPIP